MSLDLVGRVHRTVVIDGCNQIDHEKCAEMFAKRCGGRVEDWRSVSVPKEDPRERVKRLRRAHNIFVREERERKEAAAKASADAATATVAPSAVAVDLSTPEDTTVVEEVASTTSTSAVAPEEKEEIIEMVHRIFIVFVDPEVAQIAVGMTGMAFGGPRNILNVWIANETTIDGRPRLTASNSHGHVLDKNDTKSGYYDDEVSNRNNNRSDLLRIVGFKSKRDANDAQPAGGGLLMIGGPSSTSAPPPRQKRVDTEEELEIIRKRKELLAALGGNMASFRADIGGSGEEDVKPENHTKSRVPNSMSSEEKEQFLSHHFVRQCGALTRLTEERVRALADEVAVWERRVLEAEKSYK